jgi:hypothetical protein
MPQVRTAKKMQFRIGLEADHRTAAPGFDFAAR